MLGEFREFVTIPLDAQRFGSLGQCSYIVLINLIPVSQPGFYRTTRTGCGNHVEQLQASHRAFGSSPTTIATSPTNTADGANIIGGVRWFDREAQPRAAGSGKCRALPSTVQDRRGHQTRLRLGYRMAGAIKILPERSFLANKSGCFNPWGNHAMTICGGEETKPTRNPVKVLNGPTAVSIPARTV